MSEPVHARPALSLLLITLLAFLGLGVSAPSWAQAPPPTASSEEDPGSADQGAAEEGEDGEAEEEDDRITFSVKLSAERGGGRVEGKAGDFEYQEDAYLIATEEVEIKYQDITLKADRLRIDIPRDLVTAEGNIILDEGPQRLTGDTLEYDLNTRTGRLTNAHAQGTTPEYYFWGDEVAKIGENRYTVVDGALTSCNPETPSWSFRFSRARIELEGYAHIKNARFKARKVPLLYWPYIVWPAKTERSSGFLIPMPGYSSRRGAYLGLAYFQTLGRSADATVFADLYSEEFYGGGLEVRYRPSEKTTGLIRGHYVVEPDELDPLEFPVVFDPDRVPGVGEDRWKLQYFHQSDNLWEHYKAVISYQDYSDFDYLRDYERVVANRSRATIYSNAYLSGNFAQSSFTLQVDQRERVVNQSRGIKDLRRQLPELEYFVRPTRLGTTPIYFELKSGLHYFTVERSQPDPNDPDEEQTFSFEYGRANLRPNFSVPLSTLPWLSVKANVGGSVTWYEDSLNEDQTDFTGENLTRAEPLGSLEIVGPSFSRIFEKQLGSFSKFKHLIEPRVTYFYAPEYEDQNRVSVFDEVDDYLPANGVVVEVINRLLGKPIPKEKEEDEEGEEAEGEDEATAPAPGEPGTDAEEAIASVESEEGELSTEDEGAAADADDGATPEIPAEPEATSAFEIASFSLSQVRNFTDFDFTTTNNDNRRNRSSSREGPIRANLRINPSAKTSFELEAVYRVDVEDLQSTKVSGGTAFGEHHAIGLSWFTNYQFSNFVFDDDGEIVSAERVTSSDQARFNAKVGLWPGRISLDLGLTYDLDESVFRYRTFVLSWLAKCYSLRLEYSESKLRRPNVITGLDSDRDFRFSVTLKNVGTFLDLNGGLN